MLSIFIEICQFKAFYHFFKRRDYTILMLHNFILHNFLFYLFANFELTVNIKRGFVTGLDEKKCSNGRPMDKNAEEKK